MGRAIQDRRPIDIWRPADNGIDAHAYIAASFWLSSHRPSHGSPWWWSIWVAGGVLDSGPADSLVDGQIRAEDALLRIVESVGGVFAHRAQEATDG